MAETFEDKELQILRDAVDNATSLSGIKLAQSETIKKIIGILETFLRTHKTLCYGGTAINNILPEQYRFYNKGNPLFFVNSILSLITSFITTLSSLL